DVTDVGNFEHRNILHPTLTLEQLAKMFRREVADVQQLIADAKQKLFTVREGRIKPGRDEKILASWNGLMLSAFADAAKVLGHPRYGEIARHNADFLWTRLYRDARLLHSFKDGQARFNAYLDDYAFVAAALVDLYEATFERVYLDRAVALTEILLSRFWDEKEGGFYFTSTDHEALISRSKSAFDGAIPSGNSVAVFTLLRLSFLTENARYLEKAEKTLRLFYDAMEQNPFGFSLMLGALDLYLRRPKEIVILGDPQAAATTALLAQLHSEFIPNKTLRCVDPGRGEKIPSLVAGRTQVDGKLTVYVCHNFTCSLPVTEWSALRALLLT
ncbi:MAG: thioredoxin domain-containing protein, partial [Terriglobia bacterium]